MNEPSAPFVQMSIEVLDVLPQMCGCRAVVFLALGAFVPDPIAPSARDLRRFCGLSKPSVSEALNFLCSNHHALCFEGEDGIRRYRPADKYFRYRSDAPICVRERVPVSESTRVIPELGEGKFSFTSSSVVVVKNQTSSEVNSSNNNKQTLPEVLSILRKAGLDGNLLYHASEGLDENKARRIFEEWVPNAPESFTAPAVYAAKRLIADPEWEPKRPKRKQTWMDGFEEFVTR